MPYATSIDNHYNDFGNGYVPFFAVIGASQMLYYGDNGYEGAVNTMQDAIESFSGIQIQNPIDDVTLIFEEEMEIDISDVFYHPDNNDFDVNVTGNTNDDIVATEINGDILTLTAQNIIGNSTITLTASNSEDAISTEFMITVQDPSLETIIEENFESGEEWPEGWQMTTNSSVGWFLTQDGSSTYWSVPAGDGYYACANDDAANDDGSMDFLIMPELDLSDYTAAVLNFQSFYTAAYYQEAYVKVSENGGDSWETILDVSDASSWLDVQAYLTDFCGEGHESVLIAFHADDTGEWASGWAVDNVVLQVSGGAGNGNNEITASSVVLNQNYPNPFNPETEISFSLENSSDNAVIAIYNLKGQKVKTLIPEKGNTSVIWNGRNENRESVSSGIYFYKLLVNGNSKSIKKMTLIK